MKIILLLTMVIGLSYGDYDTDRQISNLEDRISDLENGYDYGPPIKPRDFWKTSENNQKLQNQRSHLLKVENKILEVAKQCNIELVPKPSQIFVGYYDYSCDIINIRLSNLNRDKKHLAAYNNLSKKRGFVFRKYLSNFSELPLANRKMW